MMAFRPRSLTTVLVGATLLVLLPVGAAAWLAGHELRVMAARADELVERATETAALAGAMVEQIPALERNGRLYAALGDADLLESFRERQRRFLESVDRLADYAGLPDESGTVNQLRWRTWNAAKAVSAREPAEGLEASFTALNRAGRVAAEASRQAVEAAVARLKAESRDARRGMRRIAWLVVPAVLLLAWFLFRLVARPMRRLDRAIRSLGDGSLERPIRVAGPRDLEQLGQRLDWLRQRLREVNDERDRFLRHMSHELKTPLANIREGTELLADGTLGETTTTQREVLGIVQENSVQLQQLIERLLGFSAWHGRRNRLSREPVDFGALVGEVAARHQLAMAARGIELVLDLSPVIVAGDRDHLSLVADNLLSNAAKFASDRGLVSVLVKRHGHEAVMEVADDGPGVANDDRALIFEPFYQGRAPAAGRVRGTGIGLSIVVEVVTAYGGTVALVDHPGKGARFRVCLPTLEGRIDEAA